MHFKAQAGFFCAKQAYLGSLLWHRTSQHPCFARIVTPDGPETARLAKRKAFSLHFLVSLGLGPHDCFGEKGGSRAGPALPGTPADLGAAALCSWFKHLY